MDVEFYFIGVIECVGWEFEFPDAVFDGGEGVRCAVPRVEIANERDGLGSGEPFADDPLVEGRAEVDAAEAVGAAVCGEGAVFFADFVEGLVEAICAVEDGWGLWSEPWVVLD